MYLTMYHRISPCTVQTLMAVGEHLKPARASGGRETKISTLKEVYVPANKVPSPSDKPTYHTVVAYVSNIDNKPERAMYYLANPENGRKASHLLLFLVSSSFACVFRCFWWLGHVRACAYMCRNSVAG